MRRTVYLPDELCERVDQYLRTHPEQTFSGPVREALTARVTPKDPTSILEIAGIVKNAKTFARDHPED